MPRNSVCLGSNYSTLRLPEGNVVTKFSFRELRLRSLNVENFARKPADESGWGKGTSELEVFFEPA